SLDDKAKKALFADLDHALAERWGAEIPAEVAALASRWQALAQEFKVLTADKQTCSRQFGEVKRQGGDIEAVKARMQAVSAALGALTAEQKALEAQILERLAPAPESPAVAAFPPRFESAPLPPGTPPARVVDAATLEDQAWDAYVTAQPRASLYHA